MGGQNILKLWKIQNGMCKQFFLENVTKIIYISRDIAWFMINKSPCIIVVVISLYLYVT